MRAYGALFSAFPLPADSVQTVFLTGGSSAQAMDWPTPSGGAAANASSGACQLVCFTGMTSAGAALGFMVNLVSTHANVPTSGTSVTTGTTVGSTGNSIPINGEAIFQIPTWSTGWSVASFSSGYVMAQIWRK